MTTQRLEALAALGECAALAPDIRLGQMMMFLEVYRQGRFDRSLWDLEDDELLNLLREHRSDLANRTPPLAAVA